MRLRTVFLITLGLIILWVLYLQREILTPFILAAIFAYIFNPLVNFLSEKIKIPRTLSVIIIYVLIIAVLVSGGMALTKRIIEESSQLQQFVNDLIKTAQDQVRLLPGWVKPAVIDTISSLDKSQLLTSSFVFAFFPQAFSRIVSFIIFAFSAFYLLKEGRNIIDKFLNFLPKEYRIETEILLRKINSVLGGYLRGQLLLIVIMSVIYYIALSLLGVKFALFLAVFSGFAEIIPIIGPIVGGAVAATVAYVSGSANFGLSPLSSTAIVIGVYFAANQIQEYFIKPFVIGKITKLHPLIILFAVIAGGSMAGMLGLILAVPIAAVVRILLEFSMDKISDSERKSK